MERSLWRYAEHARLRCWWEMASFLKFGSQWVSSHLKIAFLRTVINPLHWQTVSCPDKVPCAHDAGWMRHYYSHSVHNGKPSSLSSTLSLSRQLSSRFHCHQFTGCPWALMHHREERMDMQGHMGPEQGTLGHALSAPGEQRPSHTRAHGGTQGTQSNCHQVVFLHQLWGTWLQVFVPACLRNQAQLLWGCSRVRSSMRFYLERCHRAENQAVHSLPLSMNE